MHQLALGLAKNKLLVAAESCAQLQSATSYHEAELAWSAFIMAASTVYSKLEQGAKCSGKSQAWFGRKKKDRRSDPLLRYLHFARNSDEHGMEFGTYRNMPTLDGKPLGFSKDQFGKEIPLQVQKVDSVTHRPVGSPSDATLEGPNIVLRTVTDDRFHDSCDPPKEHLGQPIQKTTPQKVAELGLSYLKQMVTEAEALVVLTR